MRALPDDLRVPLLRAYLLLVGAKKVAVLRDDAGMKTFRRATVGMLGHVEEDGDYGPAHVTAFLAAHGADVPPATTAGGWLFRVVRAGAAAASGTPSARD